MRKQPQNVKEQLLDSHWRHVYNWDDVNDNVLDYLATRWQCSVAYIKSVMREIEREHPKPKQTHRNADTCRKCGQPIVWIGKHACNPTVVNAVLADESMHSVRLPHTCQQWHGESGIEASVGK